MNTHTHLVGNGEDQVEVAVGGSCGSDRIGVPQLAFGRLFVQGASARAALPWYEEICFDNNFCQVLTIGNSLSRAGNSAPWIYSGYGVI